MYKKTITLIKVKSLIPIKTQNIHSIPCKVPFLEKGTMPIPNWFISICHLVKLVTIALIHI